MATKKPKLETGLTGDKKAEFDALIGVWYQAANALIAAEAQESALRTKIYDMLYADDDQRRSVAGSDHFAMPGGWELQIERRVNCSIDRATLPLAQKVIAELEPDPETGVVPSLDGVIQWSPKLSDSGYRNIDARAKEVLEQFSVLEFKPGKPGVKLVLPKSVQAKATPKGE